jgi:hypothetical protein
MLNQKTYSVIAGRYFSDTLLDIAFVLGVVGTILCGVAFMTTAVSMAVVCWVVGAWLLGMAITVLCGAYLLSTPVTNEPNTTISV